MAGIASTGRRLSARATPADLWASLDALAADPARLTSNHGQPLDVEDARRFSAYVYQAKEYFKAIGGIDPAAKPLIGYYFVLNLTKAYLTAVDPGTTRGKTRHGVTPDLLDRKRYRFSQEGFKVQQSGVLRLLANRTGQHFCWSSGYRIGLRRALAYLPEAHDLYADAYREQGKLLPAHSIRALFGEVNGAKSAWLRVDIEKETLRQRRLGAERLLTEARAFGDRFRLVHDDDLPHCFSFESKALYPYRRLTEALPALAALFDASLFAVQRQRRTAPKFVVLSKRPQLLSHEALCFAVMHNLSDMVRYRPATVEKLRGTIHYWVFASWVDRACEDYLLAIASRIAAEEHSID